MRKFYLTLLFIFAVFTINVLAVDEWIQTSGPKIDENTFESVYSVAIDENDHIYAGTNGNGVYKSTDNGNSWNHILNNDFSIWRILIDNNGYIFLATEMDGIWRSTDAGETWEESFEYFGLITDIVCSPSNQLYFSTEMEGIWKSTDNGNSWETLWMPEIIIWSLTTDINENIYAGTMGDGLFISTDFGENWTVQDIDAYLFWDLATNSDYSKVFAGSEENGIWEYNTSTSVWTQIGFSATSVTSIEVNSEGAIAICSGNTEVYLSDPDYLWYPFNEGLASNSINDFAFQSNGKLYTGLFDYGVYKTVKSTYIPQQSLNFSYSIFCAGYNGAISYNANGAFYPDNQFKIEMSDGLGDFANSTIIGYTNAQESGDIYITIPTNSLYNDGYRVRLVSTNPELITDPSDPFIINTFIPTIYSPENDAIDVSLRPYFSWNELPACVEFYRLWVDDNADFLSPEIEEYEYDNWNYQPNASLQPNTTYYWKVAGENSNGIYAWSDVYTFTTVETKVTMNDYPTILCAGETNTIYYTAEGEFADDNQFQVELSDENGNFDDANIIGIAYSNVSGEIIIDIPQTLPFGTDYKFRILSTNPELVTAPSDMVVTIKPIIPNLLMPNDMDVDVSINPILEWTIPSECAYAYFLMVDTSPEFINNQIHEYGLTSNYFEVLDVLEYNTTYYWKVAGMYSEGIYTFSDVFSFTTLPNMLELALYPNTICAGTSDFVYYNAGGQFGEDNEFRVQLSDPSGDFENSTIIGSINSQIGGKITITIPNDFIFSEDYKLRIVSTNPELISTESNLITINILKPELVLPEYESAEEPVRPVFEWLQPSGCVVNYNLVVSDNAEFANPEIDVEVWDAYYQPADILKHNTVYFWKVAGINSYGVKTFSEVYTFTTKETTIQLDTYPNSICPGETNSVFFTFDGEFGNNNEFKVELSDENGNFSGTNIIGLTSQQSLEIPFTVAQTTLPGNNYKFRILTTNPELISAPSNTLEIKQLSPNLTMPGDGEIDVIVKNPILEWTASSDCADSYILILDDNEDFLSPIIDRIELSGNYYEITQKLEYNTTYYWKVAGVYSEGVYAYSDVFTFTTEELKEVTQNVALAKGWNLVSLFVTPNTPDMKDIFASIKTKIIIAKNSAGKIYLTSNDQNTIGDWNVKEGYMVYASEACTLSVTGLPVIPEETPIVLSKSGWHYISYLRNNELSIVTALETITSTNKLVIAKNVAGKIYLPPNNNTIGNMIPGVGYQIYVTGACTLTYPEN